MAPSRVTDADFLEIWRRMEVKGQRVRAQQPRFVSGSTCMSAKAAKAKERNFSTEIFRIVKVIHRRPRVVYELDVLNGTPIVGQFYQDELSPVLLRVGRLTG